MTTEGQIVLFAGKYIPQGWKACNGAQESVLIPALTCKRSGTEVPYVMMAEYPEMDEPFMGFVYPTALDFPNKGWLICMGQQLNVNWYSALFSLLGNRFGGDGVNTFALPDLPPTQTRGKGVLYYQICINGVYPMPKM